MPFCYFNRKGKKDGQFKKNYTETELVAAVKDIRSGKLGTRRAAVLYGIPRSTLRNKIFKMEAEMQNGGDKNLSIGGLIVLGISIFVYRLFFYHIMVKL